MFFLRGIFTKNLLKRDSVGTLLFSSTQRPSESIQGSDIREKIVNYINQSIQMLGRGQWIMIPGNSFTEIGKGKMSGNKAIATSHYHIEVENGSLAIFDKKRRDENGHFTKVTNQSTQDAILRDLCESSPQILEPFQRRNGFIL